MEKDKVNTEKPTELTDAELTSEKNIETRKERKYISDEKLKAIMEEHFKRFDSVFKALSDM